MKTKDLKINFRYLCGNIACLSVDSTNGEVIHNDIDNEEAIIIFNSLINAKENCQTVKILLKKYKKQKEVIDNINLIIKGLAYGGSEDYYMENFSKINELLKGVSE